MSEFKIPPISTLSGSTLSNFNKTTKGRLVEKKYYKKYLLTKLLLIAASPFHLWEDLTINRKAKNYKIQTPPVFILGHWRSGTTLLHNLLCRSDDAAFISTYHSLFPNNLKSKWIFKNFMKVKMPLKRPGDNVKLNVDFPQEDEFAVGNVMPHSYYNFFYFPKDYKEYYDNFVRFKGLKTSDIEIWEDKYKMLITKALMNSKGTRMIIKNPVNTGRLKLLSECYPQANFIHIYRNPITVYLSTKKFFRELFPTLWFHEVNQDFIIEMIIDVYKKLYSDYFDQKKKVSSDRIYEVKFEAFEKDPIAHLEAIYNYFDFDDFENQRVNFEKYLSSLKGYRKNKYTISRAELDKIEDEWDFAFDKWNYELPQNMEVY